MTPSAPVPVAPGRPRRERRRRGSGPLVVLDPPPAYLREVSSRHLYGPHASPDAILADLRRRGIMARPTLAEIEAERARRNLRHGEAVAISSEPVSRVVLPMPTGNTGRTPEEIREEGRRNRARIEAALGERSADVRALDRLGSQIARSARREEREAVA